MSILGSPVVFGGPNYTGDPVTLDAPAAANTLLIYCISTAYDPEELTGINVGLDAASQQAEHITVFKNGHTGAERLYSLDDPDEGELVVQPVGSFSAGRYLHFIAVFVSEDTILGALTSTQVAASVQNEARSHEITVVDRSLVLTFAGMNGANSSIGSLNSSHFERAEIKSTHVAALFGATPASAGSFTTGAQFSTATNREGSLISIALSGATLVESDIEVSPGFMLAPSNAPDNEISAVSIEKTGAGSATLTVATTGASGTIYGVSSVRDEAPESADIENGEGLAGSPVPAERSDSTAVSGAGDYTLDFSSLSESSPNYLYLVHPPSNILKVEFSISKPALEHQDFSLSITNNGEYCS